MSKRQLIYRKLSPLSIHFGRYSDKYMNNAMLDALHWRFRCYECGITTFQYDPDDKDYMKCHKCGARKRVPTNIADFTPDWGNEQRRRDGFKWLYSEFKENSEE